MWLASYRYANVATPAELTAVAVPAARFAVATVTGDEPDIYMQAHDLLDGEVKARHLAYNENVGCLWSGTTSAFSRKTKEQ